MTEDSERGRAAPDGPDPALCERHARRLEKFLVKRPYLPTDVKASIGFAIEILERLAKRALVIWILLPMPGANAADVFSGAAVAADGMTVLVDTTNGEKPFVEIRLWGVDGPELSDWPHGTWARGALDEIMGIGLPVTCRQVDEDQDGRPLAICGHSGEDGSQDFGADLVETGWAIFDRRVFLGSALDNIPKNWASYDSKEQNARKARRGLWRAWSGVAGR